MAEHYGDEINTVLKHLLENDAMILRPFLNPTQLQSFRAEAHDVHYLPLADNDLSLPFRPEPYSDFLNSATGFYFEGFEELEHSPDKTDGPLIFLSPSRWKATSAAQREALVFHEITFYTYLEKYGEYPITKAFFESRKKFWSENGKSFQRCELNTYSAKDGAPLQHVTWDHLSSKDDIIHRSVSFPLSNYKTLAINLTLNHSTSVDTLAFQVNRKHPKVIRLSPYEHLENGLSSAGSVYEFMPDSSQRVRLQCFR